MNLVKLEETIGQPNSKSPAVESMWSSLRNKFRTTHFGASQNSKFKIQDSKFLHNCEKGIFTYYSYLVANNNTMTDIQTGIETNNCRDLLRTVVRGNTISASKFGINWYSNAGSRIMSAQNNIITMDGNARGEGISLNEGSSKDSANYVICPGNTVTINGSRVAIHARNVYLPLIALNNISMNYGTINSANIDGILIEGCDKARVIENNVMGDNAMNTDTSTTSISTRLSSNGAIICNTTVNSGFGFFFGSLNPGTQFNPDYALDISKGKLYLSE